MKIRSGFVSNSSSSSFILSKETYDKLDLNIDYEIMHISEMLTTYLEAILVKYNSIEYYYNKKEYVSNEEFLDRFATGNIYCVFPKFCEKYLDRLYDLELKNKDTTFKSEEYIKSRNEIIGIEEKMYFEIADLIMKKYYKEEYYIIRAYDHDYTYKKSVSDEEYIYNKLENIEGFHISVSEH